MDADKILHINPFEIHEGKRMREDYRGLQSLQLSMESQGLIHPVIVTKTEQGWLLVVGGRRVAAAKGLEWETIACIEKENLSELELREIEHEENLRREDLTWEEEVKSVHEIHRLKVEKYQKHKLYPGAWRQKQTAEEIGWSEGKVSVDIKLAEALEKWPALRKCRTKREAMRMYRRLIEGAPLDDDLESVRRIKESFIAGEWEEALDGIEDNSVDLIISDISENIQEVLLDRLNKTLNRMGHAFLFFPLEDHLLLISHLERMKVRFERRPFIWHIKREDTYQSFVWFSKNMASPPKHVHKHYSFGRDKGFLHDLEKPAALFQHLVQNSTVKGAFVLDPISYGYAMTKVCLEMGRNVRAFCPYSVLYSQVLINLESPGR